MTQQVELVNQDLAAPDEEVVVRLEEEMIVTESIEVVDHLPGLTVDVDTGITRVIDLGPM